MPILLAALVGAGAIGACSFGLATSAGAAASPQVHLSTTVIVPGHTITISGSGWPVGTVLQATLCGADAISGTADCAVESTATVIAVRGGIFAMPMTPTMPPQPCPCVVLVTGSNSGYVQTIPVIVVGARSAPIQELPPSFTPGVRLSGLRVVGAPTVASLFGAAARREVELRLTNREDRPVRTVLVGRWGTGGLPQNVIDMPAVPVLAAGESRLLHASFDLPAFSLGDYTVRVEVLVMGGGRDVTMSAPTSQWPVALLVCGYILLGLVVFWLTVAVAGIVKTRR